MILYKYYGFSAGIAALESQKLGFRAAKEFNDPFEFGYLDNPAVANLKDTIDTLKQTLGVLSLTRTPYNPLMWAHYGEDHRGFVIGYDVEDEFLQSNNFNIIAINDGDVVYEEVKEKIEATEHTLNVLGKCFHVGQGEFLSSYSPQEQEEIITMLRKILLYKHTCWSYEKEVRVVKVIDSAFEESHIWQGDPRRSFVTLHKSVLPGIACITIPGLYIFNNKASIKEVYVGLRNPLLSRYPDESVKSKKLAELAEDFSWTVQEVFMSNGSWGLDSRLLSANSLFITDKVKGLLNSFNFTGTEAVFLSEKIHQSLSSSNDWYEFTNWSGDFGLKKNGIFIE